MQSGRWKSGKALFIPCLRKSRSKIYSASKEGLRQLRNHCFQEGKGEIGNCKTNIPNKINRKVGKRRHNAAVMTTAAALITAVAFLARAAAVFLPG